MEIEVGKIYKKTSQIIVVKVLKNGNVIVCNKFDISDVWEISKEVFEKTYIEWE